MTPKTRKLGTAAVAVTILLLVAVLAFSLGQSQVYPSGEGAYDAQRASMETAYDSAPVAAGDAAGSTGALESAVEQRSTADVDSPSTGAASEKLVIRTANMDMSVGDIDVALTGVRAAARALGAEISDLSVVTGDVQVPGTEGMATSSPTQGPATAYVTLRVPADKLEALEAKIAKLGTMLTQSSNANDVTEQAIDMEARLNNLRAEEARLRTFLTKTNKVSELLEVERELARVRGEIEAMDAQLTYLERQVARSTLTITLSEPGPVVQPAGPTWGIREAVTRGIQAAATLVTTLITVAIPLALLALVLGMVAWPVRTIQRRRAAKRQLAHDGADTVTDPSDEDDQK